MAKQAFHYGQMVKHKLNGKPMMVLREIGRGNYYIYECRYMCLSGEYGVGDFYEHELVAEEKKY